MPLHLYFRSSGFTLVLSLSACCLLLPIVACGRANAGLLPRGRIAEGALQMQPTGLFDSVDIDLPAGWVEVPNSGGPRTFQPRSDGTTGLLQVSRLPDSDVGFISNHPDLGSLAAHLGKGLGERGENWGESNGTKEGTCSSGRFGLAMFKNGKYPAMFIWVTVSSGFALLWTWLGPSPVADEVKQALRIVLEARPHQRP
jgi:hypothetical protein